MKRTDKLARVAVAVLDGALSRRSVREHLRTLERLVRLARDEIAGVHADQREMELEMERIKEFPPLRAWLDEQRRADELTADKREVLA